MNSRSSSKTAAYGRLIRQASMPAAPGGFGLAVVAQQPIQTQTRVTRTPVVRSATSAKDTILAWVQQSINHYEVIFNGQ